MKQFAYIFSLGGKCEWSGETSETVERRADNDADRDEIKGLVSRGNPGDFITLSTGEIVVCTSVS